jgi:effector-binding domain-containing protein
MQVKEVKPINFLYFRTEAKVSELQNFLPVGQELFKEAVQRGLFVTGPVHWHYENFNGDESKPFTLQIAIPVAELPSNYNGKFHVKRTEPFKCVILQHEGSWFDMPTSYAKAMSYITSNNLVPTSRNREIYINADFQQPEANVTEIQIGVN